MKLRILLLNSDDSFTISILIGAYYYWTIAENPVIRGPGPTAVASKFGFLLSGPILSASDDFTQVSFFISAEENDSDMLQKFWDLESIGIKQTSEEEAVEPLGKFREQYIERRDNHYVSKLQWKDEHEPLRTNYDVTAARTRSMIRKLSPALCKVYDRIIRDQEIRGFIECVPIDDKQNGHYLPHHAVQKDSPTTPIRVVYDCSCKQSQSTPSLNDCLDKGPKLLNELAALLLRFRVNNFAFVSDIEKAF